MNPIVIRIGMPVTDVCIYAGHLFVVQRDGRIRYAAMSRMIHRLLQQNAESENLLRLAFLRNDYFQNHQGELVWGVPEVLDAFRQRWQLEASITYEITLEEEDLIEVGVVDDSPVLDMKAYAMRLFLGFKHGAYEVNLNQSDDQYHISPSKPRRVFDGKAAGLSARSGEVMISSGSSGLFNGTFLNERSALKVNDRPFAQNSIRTAWTGYDLVNYQDQIMFEYFFNETSKSTAQVARSKFDEGPDRKITKLGVGHREYAEILEKSEIDPSTILYTFNSSEASFAYDRAGQLQVRNFQRDRLAEKKDVWLSSRPRTVGYSENNPGRPLSHALVPRGCLLEFFDSVRFYQNGEVKELETGPCLGLRSYVGSRRYRNLVTLIKEDYFSVMATFPIDIGRAATRRLDFDNPAGEDD